MKYSIKINKFKWCANERGEVVIYYILYIYNKNIRNVMRMNKFLNNFVIFAFVKNVYYYYYYLFCNKKKPK